VRKNRLTSRLSAYFVLIISCFPLAVQGAEKKAIVQGVTHANLRTGPGVSHPAKTIVNQNDQLLIQGKEGEWYSVATMDGQQGYVHQSLVRVVGDEFPHATRDNVVATPPGGKDDRPSISLTTPAPSLTAPKAPPTVDVEAAPKNVEPTPLTAKPAPSPPPSVAGVHDSTTMQAKSSALIHSLEGREGDMILWLAIAVAFFFIGWICGGNYYLRRDRLRRTKLRF